MKLTCTGQDLAKVIGIVCVCVCVWVGGMVSDNHTCI